MKQRVIGTGLTVCLCVALLLSSMSVPVSAKSKASKKVNVKKVKVTSVMGSTKKAYVAKGKKVKLTGKVTVKPSKKTYQKLKWSVKGKKSVLSVSQKGIVKGKKKGTVKVRVNSRTNKKKSAVITVKVVPGVKSVKATKKTATIAVGGTTKMKVKVKGPKGCYKGVVYSSKNKKVAKVNRKGVITGVAEGTVKITATAADGTKKKASIIVTVTPVGTKPGTNTDTDPNATPNPTTNALVQNISIQAVTFLHEKRISIDLSHPIELKKEDFDIAVVSRVDSTRCKGDIKKVITTDHKHYVINMMRSTNASEYDDYEVTISSLPGNGVKTMKNATRKIVTTKDYSESLNDTTNTLLRRDNNTYYDGYRLVSAQNLPEGITVNEHPDEAYMGINVDGKASQNGITSTFIYEGPYGLSKVEHITWNVAATGQLVIAPNNPGYDHISIAVGEDSNKAVGIHWVKGSGVSLTNQLVDYVRGAPDGLTVTCYNNSIMYFRGTVNTPGTYPIKVGYSTENASTEHTFYLEVSHKTLLSMKLKDLSGQAYAYTGDALFFANDDFTKEPLTYTMNSGEMQSYVPEGTYTVYAGGQYFEQVEIHGDSMELNPVIEQYRVKLVNSTPGVAGYFTAIEDNHSTIVIVVDTDDPELTGYAEIFNPDKVFTGIVQYGTVTHSATVRMLSMSNGEITAELTATPISQASIDLGVVGEYKTLSPMKAEDKVFSFTPTETGMYYLDIKNDHYMFPYINAYSNGNTVEAQFDKGLDYYHMVFTRELVAGRTYEFYVSFYTTNLNQSLSLAMVKQDS